MDKVEMEKIFIERNINSSTINIFYYGSNETIINFFSFLDAWGANTGIKKKDCIFFEVIPETEELLKSERFYKLCRAKKVKVEVNL